MAANVSTRDEILKNMMDLDTITSNLSNLKMELKKKEGLLLKMEDALKMSEERLKRKVSEIDEKDKRLGEIEEKLLKRQEELMIQEKVVQTNAILEYLSFQAREMEIQERMKYAPDPVEIDSQRNELRSLKDQIRARDEEIERLRSNPVTITVPGAPSEETTRSMKEIEQMRSDLESMRHRIEQREIEILKREEELRNKEHKLASSLTGDDQKVNMALKERENDLKKMEDQIRNKQKEISRFMEGLDIKDVRIKELENELNFKEHLLKAKEAEFSSGTSSSQDLKDLKDKLEVEYQTKLTMLEGNYKTQIDSFRGKLDQLKVRNEELEMMGDQLSADKLRVALLEKEMKERMNEISFAEERLARRQELMMKERKQIDEKEKKLKDTSDGSKVVELSEELANREKQLRDIEMKLREREEYLRKKEQEMERLRSSVIDGEMKIEKMEAMDDLSRVKTGVRRFDDLTYGGFPHNSNFILYGPAYSGRTTFTNLFIAEGLKKGVPAIYITTQHTPQEVKDQFRVIIPKVEAYEQQGLLRFIDMYSKSMGITEELPNTIYIEKPTDLDALGNAIEKIQGEFKGKFQYHKIVFFSASTLLTYVEPLSIFRFFQVLNAKNKRSNCCAIYIVDTGMHKESDIQTLKHVMNGFIEFKLEDLKYFLRLEGGGDVMSRAWIEYTFTDKSFDLRGSFSLDHIR